MDKLTASMDSIKDLIEKEETTMPQPQPKPKVEREECRYERRTE
jgi:hypothetical protein